MCFFGFSHVIQLSGFSWPILFFHSEEIIIGKVNPFSCCIPFRDARMYLIGPDKISQRMRREAATVTRQQTHFFTRLPTSNVEKRTKNDGSSDILIIALDRIFVGFLFIFR